MDPFSIYELTSTVIQVGWKLYKFFDAVHGAPEEVQEYLRVLKSCQVALGEVRDYLGRFKASKTYQHDPTMLRALETVLQECNATFTLQLQTIEKYRTDESMSTFKKLRKQVAFVLGEEALRQTTAKLEGSQQILLICLSTSTGRTTIGISENVASMQTDVQDIAAVLRAEEKERTEFRQSLDRFAETLMKEMGLRSKFAQDSSTQSFTRLNDLVTVSDNIITSTTETALPSNPTTWETSEQAPEPGSSDTPDKDYSASAAAKEGFENFKTSLGSGKRAFFEDGESPISADLRGLHVKDDSKRPNNLARLNQTLGANTLLVGTVYGSSPSSPFQLMVPLLSRLSPLQSSGILDMLTHALTEMSNTMKIGNRELELRPNPVVYGLVVEAYQALFETLQLCNDISKRIERDKFRANFMKKNVEEEVEGQMGKMRTVIDRLLREAEYSHRLEMHMASNKITQMHLEQQKMIRMLDDQKRLLESMQEERKIMDVVRDQQKILQVLLQIQTNLLPPAPPYESVEKASQA